MRLGALAIKVLALRSKDQQEATKKAKQQYNIKQLFLLCLSLLSVACQMGRLDSLTQDS